MPTPILLKVHFGDADSEQKLLFDEHMRRYDWCRFADSELYTAEFDGAESDEELLAHVEGEVTMIAESCGIYDLQSTAALG